MFKVSDIELTCSNPKEINLHKIKRHKLFFPLSIIQLIKTFYLYSIYIKTENF